MAKIFGGKASLWRANSAALGEVNFTKIAQVKDISESGGESNMIDTTNRDDLATSLAMVQQPALIGAVSLDFTIQFDPDLAQHLDMLLDAETQVERNFQVRITGVTNRIKYRGFQKAIPRTYPMDNLVEGRTGVACSARPTIAP
jgi:hypothetical protein